MCECRYTATDTYVRMYVHTRMGLCEVLSSNPLVVVTHGTATTCNVNQTGMTVVNLPDKLVSVGKRVVWLGNILWIRSMEFLLWPENSTEPIHKIVSVVQLHS